MTRRRELDPEGPQAQVEELFAEVWQLPRYSGSRRGFRPNVDVFHTDKPHELTVVVELPGVDPESLMIVISERTLLIAGERRRDRAGDARYQQMEIEYGPIHQRVTLTEDVDPDAARARYARGMLSVSLPVAGAPQAGRRAAIIVEFA